MNACIRACLVSFKMVDVHISVKLLQALCRIFDGYLAEINSADENSFIEGVARNRSCECSQLHTQLKTSTQRG